MKNRFYLFGSNHMKCLSKVLDPVGHLFGVSPLSCAEEGKLWQRTLSDELERAEYFVLDLYTALQPLLSAHGLCLTATDRNVQAMQSDPLAVLEPMRLPQSRIFELLEPFVQLLRTHFDRRHIILVRTCIPEFYWIEKSPRMRSNFQSYAPKQNWLHQIEDYFIERTQCRTVGIERFYFHRKEIGRPLTEHIFEEYCYLDMAQCIDGLLHGTVRTRPNFRYSLQRYIDGKFTLYQRAFTQFLQQDYLLDALILSSPKEFVEENAAELEALDEIDWTDLDNALKMLETIGVSEHIRRITYAFARLTQGIYDDSRADYALLLRNHIVPAALLATLRAKTELAPVQINEANAGYHFAKMQGLSPDAFISAQTVKEPTLIDIFGSCLSRTILNVQENDFAVNHYWFQVPPVFGAHGQISYPAELFPEKPHWADRLVKAQFDDAIRGQMETSAAQWLMIDLFAFVTVVQYRYQNLFYIDYNTTVSKKLGAEKVCAYKDPSVLGTWDEILEKMDSWLAAVRKKYGERVILINGQRKNHWIGDDGVLYQLKNPIDCTEFLEYLSERVAQRLNCWCIDIYNDFLPHDSAYISNTPAHKENECYFYSHELMRRIVTERPAQKRFSTYPNELRLQRLLSLREHNSAAKIQQALNLTDLDRSVIRLENEEISKYRTELKRLYVKGEQTSELKKLLKRAADRPVGAAEFNDDYPNYDAESGIVGYGCFQKPFFRSVELRQIENDRSRVRLLCASAPGSTVQLLRKTEDGFYEPLKQAAAGYIFDTEIEPLTTYSYIACSVAALGDKRFIGAFTPAKKIRTGVAIPRITSAVTVDGVNRIAWQKVEKAAGYYIYHKLSAEDAWVRCADVPADVHTWMEPAENAGFYTLRAYDEDGIAGGHNPATAITAL